MSPTHGYVTAEDRVRLFYQKLGNGPKTVIIPNGLYLFDDFKRFADSRTLIFCDLRNRGCSDSVTDCSKLKRGILNDVDDLEAVRRHFGADRIDLIGHSYVGITVALYAMKYPAHLNRVVQIGPMQPNAGTQYPVHLTGADATLTDVLSKLAQLQKEPRSEDPEKACEKFWSVLRVLYVVNPADAGKINWGRCDLPNELNFMKYWTGNILPSICSLSFTAEELAMVKAPFLIVHGTRDRSSPYGGGRDWAMMLPNAGLVTVDNAAHAPWIEAPELVFGSIQTFLDGKWPEKARTVRSLEP